MEQSESGKRYDYRMEDLECHHAKLIDAIQQRFFESILSAQRWKYYEILQLEKWKTQRATRLWYKLGDEYAVEKYGKPKLVKTKWGVLFA